MTNALAKYEVKFGYDHTNFEFWDTSKFFSVREFKLSHFLQKTFDLNNIWLGGEHMAFRTFSEIVFDTKGSEFVIVECSAVKPSQIWSGVMHSCLRMFPIPPAFGKMSEIKFHPIKYLPVQVKAPIESITIKLLDENLAPLPVASDSVTRVILQIQEKN